MRLSRLIVTVSLAASLPAPAEEVQKFGKPLAGLPSVTLASVLEKPEAGRLVRLEGDIRKVCQNKGCWMELAQGDRAVHVTFEGYSFFVPKDSAGRKAVLEGRVMVKALSADDVAHLKKEGASDTVAAGVSIEALGVAIAGPK
jgi:hypothetical protein